MSDNDQTGGLGGTFGSKTKGSQIAYGHPHAEEIINSAKKILKQSETGTLLLKVSDVHKIPINVIKGLGESGFSPQARIVYLQASGKTETADGALTLKLIKALRDADQELIGFTAPDPTKDLMEYAAVMHAKALDSIIYVCKVVKELTNSSVYKDLLDGLAELGHDAVYKAYIKEASKEELFDVYAGR